MRVLGGGGLGKDPVESTAPPLFSRRRNRIRVERLSCNHQLVRGRVVTVQSRPAKCGLPSSVPKS